MTQHSPKLTYRLMGTLLAAIILMRPDLFELAIFFPPFFLVVLVPIPLLILGYSRPSGSVEPSATQETWKSWEYTMLVVPAAAIATLGVAHFLRGFVIQAILSLCAAGLTEMCLLNMPDLAQGSELRRRANFFVSFKSRSYEMRRSLVLTLFLSSVYVGTLVASSDWVNFRSTEGTISLVRSNAEFVEFVLERFPLGTDHVTIVGELERNGFSISGDSWGLERFAAVKKYVDLNGACEWQIDWIRRNGQIVRIEPKMWCISLFEFWLMP